MRRATASKILALSVKFNQRHVPAKRSDAGPVGAEHEARAGEGVRVDEARGPLDGDLVSEGSEFGADV